MGGAKARAVLVAPRVVLPAHPTYPQRTIALVLFGTESDSTKRIEGSHLAEYLDAIDREWGTEEYAQGIAAHMGGAELRRQTVKDLVAGSGLAFDDQGEHELKGVSDRWRLYRVAG